MYGSSDLRQSQLELAKARRNHALATGDAVTATQMIRAIDGHVFAAHCTEIMAQRTRDYNTVRLAWSLHKQQESRRAHRRKK